MNPRRRRLALVVAGALVAVLLAALLPGWLRQLEFFKVRRVEVLGARYLRGPDIVAVMQVPKDASLFDDTGPYQRAVFRIRGVREVSVSRRWPGTLVVRLRESEPVALSPAEGGLALMDERGWVLPFDPTRAVADLPVASADPGIARVLARLKTTAPGLFAEVVSASASGEDVVLDLGTARVLVRNDLSADAVRALVAVMDDLARRGRRYRELDARFTDRVFVRGKTT